MSHPSSDFRLPTFKIQMKKIKIINKEEIALNVFILSLDYRPEFIPGQVLELTENPGLPPRMYSICNSPGDGIVKILFDVKKEGRLTPYLAKINPGNTIYASEARGNFTCSNSERAWWIAAGTGIAPFASMFLSGIKDNKLLIHGGRILESFYFQDLFETGLKENYIRCCSSECGEKVYQGRLTKWLNEQEELPPDNKYYLCGSAEMVVQTRDILISKNIDFDSIIAEIYF